MAASMWKIVSRKNLYRLVFDPKLAIFSMCALLLAELVVNILVIKKIKYTEIDWKAYMQEVEGVVNGTYDYTKLKGDTGPLVYPAGFVYIYLALYYITSYGHNIRLGQYLFAGLYILSLIVLFDIYRKTNKVPPYAFVFMCCASYRIHSIYVLRLFNDPVAMFFMYLAVCCFLRDRWAIGCLIYSFGVSIKMNLLLFSPALLMVMMVRLGTLSTIGHLAICAAPQVVLAIPFLLENPVGYIVRSFNFGRQFFYVWTVNWRLIPEDIFLNKYFQTALLLAHVLTLLLFFMFKWRRLYPKVKFGILMPGCNTNLSPNQILLPLWTANLIGMSFSRSLHYQFYVWYFHTLHYLLWSTSQSDIVKILILGVIELCWNTYPSTMISSSMLHLCHAFLLYTLWTSQEYTPTDKKVVATKMD
uniref:dolichyl-P-Man:Man5GlcNAc2-PP-dolichol alpha-1,3-mannosyltransferase n=1 Tax=Crassostrea virginica TaxID=6565 RepID=A0A8B8ETB5_CRAVI|nr:dol-P-Man:Man(5)GlcNAc(2)-PP-Dol alpha-1,3-mannosyltransferase-like [Crassostrea virginica]